MKEQGRLGWVRAVALVLTMGIFSPQAWSLDLDHRIASTERENAQILGTLGRGAAKPTAGHAGGLSLKLKKKKKTKVVRKHKRSKKRHS